MKTLTDRVAFVTGGASGIGLGIARALLGAGMRVAIADIRADSLARAFVSLGGDESRVHTVELDVTDREAMKRAANDVQRVFGGVHVLCANAGVGDIGYLTDTSYDDWDWIMAVTLGGVVNAVTTFLPQMLMAGEEGQVLATASMAGIVPVNHGGVYSVAKCAVVGMMEALRMELKETKIGVSVLCPGMTRTDIGATRALRPSRYAKTGYTYRPRPAPTQTGDSRNSPMALAMDPDEVGMKVLRGIRRNDLYILSHSEFGAMIKEHFDEMLNAMPDSPAGVAPAPPAGGRPPRMATPYATAVGSDPIAQESEEGA